MLSKGVVFVLYSAVALAATVAHGFVLPSSESRHGTTVFSSQMPPEERGEHAGDVDWDAEWKKVMENKDQPVERPHLLSICFTRG